MSQSAEKTFYDMISQNVRGRTLRHDVVKFIGGTHAPGRKCILEKRVISQDLIELGNRIRDRRQEMKLSQEVVAEKAEISTNTISRIEGGQSAMSIEIFMKLMQVLRMDANELLGVTNLTSEKNVQCREMFFRIQHLKQCEQTVVLKTMGTLMEELQHCK